jgi:hypothetical protein
LARDSSLDPAVARQLAHPTTIGDIGQRSRDAAASNRQNVASGLSLGAGSPFRAPSQSRSAQPNLYRPTMYGSAPPTSTRSSSSGGGRQDVEQSLPHSC